ncbi:MAG: transporter, family, multidrug resistance protein [Acidobacteriota bacterium]|jgi:DHA2 family multidrug resistance protein|nr:transporter, family, multidrug resistance protein [Acidobacteriota bacterium]
MPQQGANKWIITITVILASVIELIDTSIVNVALPQMMGNLGATLDQIAWVVTGYVVANVIVIPMTGWFASAFGRRNYFTGSLILFTVASYFCGHATGLWELMIFRFIQGAGGGAMLSTSQSILVETFPPEELGMANGLFGLGVVVGPTVGPTLGGWITDSYSWRWIFYVNLPIGIIAALMAMAFIPESRDVRKVSKVDWTGIALLVGGIGSLQIVLERGESEDWFSANYILVLSVVAVLSLAAFIWRELTIDHPIVDLKVLKDRSLAVGTFFTFIMGFGLYASVFIFPVFAQNLLGFTAMQTGLILLPGSLATAVMMPVVGKLLQRGVPPQLMNALGFISFFFFTFLLSHSTLASDRQDFFWPLILRGVGLGFLFVPLTTMALSGLRGKDIPQGAGLTNMMRQLGGSFGVALVATFIQHRSWTHRVNLLSHVSIYDQTVRDRLAAITQGLVSKGSSLFQAQQQAYGALEGAVMRQTFLLSYMDAFRVVGVFFLCCIPMLLLFKRRSAGASAPVSMH